MVSLSDVAWQDNADAVLLGKAEKGADNIKANVNKTSAH